ncbi:hypothetical protein ACFSQP_08610 [Bizionia sediminis]|uniref:DUF4783 domain-containing protein n=1 Tax=Bizionia sediminis TaxID=1737064 RepID=A0ABW5KVH0_9FLAO
MKTYGILMVFLLTCSIGRAQYVIENFSNAAINQLPIVEEIAYWLQTNQIDNMVPLMANPNTVDTAYLKSETTFLALEYTKKRILKNTHTSVTDTRQIVWYERNFYKQTKSKLKPRYQIYFTVEFHKGYYKIIDLTFGKRKKINTENYTAN